MPSRTISNEAMTRRLLVLAFGSLVASAVVGRAADPAADLLAGHAKECPKCDLAGANLKRFDLREANLAGPASPVRPCTA